MIERTAKDFCIYRAPKIAYSEHFWNSVGKWRVLCALLAGFFFAIALFPKPVVNYFKHFPLVYRMLYWQFHASIGNKDAAYHLGNAYLKQSDINSKFEAIYWLKYAASQHQTDALFTLGVLNFEGREIQKNTSLAYEYFKLAALQDVDAKYLYAQMNYFGIGTPKNQPLANALLATLYQVHPHAAYLLAAWYEKQHTHDADAQAFYWYHEGALAGDARSQYAIGNYYWSGTGVSAADSVQAARWFSLAARQNEPNAQWMLATLHHRGRVLAKDNVAAYMWLLLSCDQLQQHSCFQLKQHIATELSSNQKDIAIQMAEAFGVWAQREHHDLS